MERLLEVRDRFDDSAYYHVVPRDDAERDAIKALAESKGLVIYEVKLDSADAAIKFLEQL